MEDIMDKELVVKDKYVLVPKWEHQLLWLGIIISFSSQLIQTIGKYL